MTEGSIIVEHRNTISRLMGFVRALERFLGPEDDWVEDDRRILSEAAQLLLGRFYTFTKEKGPADYVTTVDADSDVVEVALAEAGYQRNLTSTRKYRTHHDGGKQWAVGSYVLDAADTDWQHHVYLFETEDGDTDVYAHREPSVRNPVEHLDPETGTHGDPDGLAHRALDDMDLEYYEREI